MDEHESFSDLIYEERVYMAGNELSSFIAAVTECTVQKKPGFLPRTGSRNWR